MHAVREGSENANGSKASRRPTEMPRQQRDEKRGVPEGSCRRLNRRKSAEGVGGAREGAHEALPHTPPGDKPPETPGPLSLEIDGTEGRKFVKGSLRRAKGEPALDKFSAFRRNAPDAEGKGAPEMARFRGHRSGFEELNCWKCA